MSTQNQPTIADLKRRFAAYSLAGGEYDYTHWLEVVLVATQTQLAADEECLDDIAKNSTAPSAITLVW